MGEEIKRREGGGRTERGERASEILGCRPRALCCVVYGFPGLCLNSTKTCKMQQVGGLLVGTHKEAELHSQGDAKGPGPKVLP